MILAIETSTREASLAVWDRDGKCAVHAAGFVTERAHNAVIFGPVEEILSAYRDKLEGIVVGLGPGSYGGVRVGIAVANGLGIALGIPVAGCSSLEAWNVTEDSYVVIGDARRGSFFLAEVNNRQLSGEPQLHPVDEMAHISTAYRTRGVRLFTPDSRVSGALPDVMISFPHASRIAERLGDSKFGAAGGEMLEPHYLRAPYITMPKGRGMNPAGQ